MKTTNFFKRASLFVMIGIAMAMNVNAQEKGDMAAGAHIAYGTGDSYSNFGLGAKFQWNIIKQLRLEPSFTYFLKKDYVSMWDLSLNAHYLFPIGDNLRVYPLAGVGMLGSKASVSVDLGEWGNYGASASDTEFGINLGGGVDYLLTDKLILNAEIKYKIGDVWDRLIISAGVAYRF